MVVVVVKLPRWEGFEDASAVVSRTRSVGTVGSGEIGEYLSDRKIA